MSAVVKLELWCQKWERSLFQSTTALFPYYSASQGTRALFCYGFPHYWSSIWIKRIRDRSEFHSSRTFVNQPFRKKITKKHPLVYDKSTFRICVMVSFHSGPRKYETGTGRFSLFYAELFVHENVYAFCFIFDWHCNDTGNWNLSSWKRIASSSAVPK